MKAKDTVMSDEEHEINRKLWNLLMLWGMPLEDRDEAVMAIRKFFEPFIKQAREEGRKQVVDWVICHLTPIVPDGKWDGKRCEKAELQFLEGEWQAKLKEWGIKEGQ